MPLSNSTRISGVPFFKRAWRLCIYCLINSLSILQLGWESMMNSVLYAKNQSFKKVKQLTQGCVATFVFPRTQVH